MKFKDKHNYASRNQNTGYFCAGIRSSLDWEGTQGNFVEFEEFFFFFFEEYFESWFSFSYTSVCMCVCACV